MDIKIQENQILQGKYDEVTYVMQALQQEVRNKKIKIKSNIEFYFSLFIFYYVYFMLYFYRFINLFCIKYHFHFCPPLPSIFLLAFFFLIQFFFFLLLLFLHFFLLFSSFSFTFSFLFTSILLSLFTSF